MVVVELLGGDLIGGVEDRGLCRYGVLGLFCGRSLMIVNVDGRQVESVLGCGM